MDRENRFFFNAGLIIGGFAAMLIASVIVVATATPTRSQFCAEAVKAGHAEYYLDKNHKRQWRWLPVATTPTPDGGKE